MSLEIENKKACNAGFFVFIGRVYTANKQLTLDDVNG